MKDGNDADECNSSYCSDNLNLISIFKTSDAIWPHSIQFDWILMITALGFRSD